MKNELKISRLSIACVLCATAFSGAYGASTVRTLGGTGTYNSASAASASGTSAGVARAGVARVTPAAGRVTSGATSSGATSSAAATTAGRVSAAPRLSLGKYLGGTTTVNRPSGGGNPGLSGDEDYSKQIEDLQKQIDAATNKLQGAMDAITDLQKVVDSVSKSAVQGVAEGGYISLDSDGMAYLNVAELGADSEATVSADGKTLTIRIGADGTPFSVDLPDLLSSDDINAKLEEKLTEYVTQEEFKKLKDAVDLLDADGAELTEKLSGKADIADLDKKADKLTAGDYTVGHIATVGPDGQYVDGGVSADDFAKDSDLKKLATDIGAVNESGQVVNRFESLQQEINQNMTQMLETNFTEVVDGKLVIKENSITSTELAPNSVTSVELANGAVEEENLATAITKQLIGDGYVDAAKEYPGGVAIMLVDEFGNKIWTPLEFADDESITDTGGNN